MSVSPTRTSRVNREREALLQSQLARSRVDAVLEVSLATSSFQCSGLWDDTIEDGDGNRGREHEATGLKMKLASTRSYYQCLHCWNGRGDYPVPTSFFIF